MPPRPTYFTFFLALLLLLQINHSLTATCPTGQTLTTLNGQSACSPQGVVTVTVRPTTTPFVYLLVFNGGQIPWTSILDFTANTVIKLYSGVETISSNPQNYLAYAISADLSVIQIVLEVLEIPYGTSMFLEFTDFSTVETRPSTVYSPVIAIVPSRDSPSNNSKLIDTIADIDYILEIVWIVVAFLNPFWILYMDSKLYRETIDFIKRVNVQYEPFLTSFYMENDKKTSGIRVPNVFSILIFGNSYASEWEKHPVHSIGINNVNLGRIIDTKVLIDSNTYRYNDFPFFLDNYGSELTLIAGCFILILAVESTYQLFKLHTQPQLWAKVMTVIRTMLWNFLLMTALGSCQSLIYYTAIQVQAFFYATQTSNNKISFGIAAGEFVLIMGGILGYLVWASFKRVKKNSEPVKQQKQQLIFFRPILEFYKDDKVMTSLDILSVIPRAITLSVIMITLNSSPLAQSIAMLGTSIGFFFSIVSLRPYKRTIYTVFKAIYEIILILAQTILVVLAAKDYAGNFNLDERSSLGVVLVWVWIAVPIATIVFGAVGFLFYVKEQFFNGHHGVKSAQVVPSPAYINVVKNNEKKITMAETSGTPPPTDKVKSTVFDDQKPVTNVPIFKPETNFQPHYYNDSGVNLMSSMPPQSLNNIKNTGPSSISLDEGHRGNVLRKQSAPFDLGNSGVSKSEKKPLLEGNGNGNENVNVKAITQSTFARNENTRNSSVPPTYGVRNNRPFEAIPLKLTPASLKVIDEKGFKDFVENKSVLME